MQHVFISFMHEDLDFMENVIARLEKEGFTTWADSKIGAGEEWRTVIDLAIKNSFALIVIMTPEAKASEYVTYEWAFAWGVGIRVIPLMLRPTELHPRLEALQYLDFTNKRLRPWDKLMDEVKSAADAPLSHSVSIPLNSPPFIRQAVASLDSAVRDDRRGAIETLTMAKTPAACAVLREALGHPLPDVRSSAAAALGIIEDTSALPTLIDSLKDPVKSVRCSVAQTLGSIGDAIATPGLVETLADTDEDVRSAAVESLVKINDPDSVNVLCEALKNPDDNKRASAARALGLIADHNAVSALIEALRDPGSLVRSAAAEALGNIRDPAPVSVLIELLSDSDQDVRSMASQALSAIGQNQ